MAKDGRYRFSGGPPGLAQRIVLSIFLAMGALCVLLAEVTVVKSSKGILELDIRTAGWSSRAVSLPGGKFIEVSLDDCEFYSTPGDPRIPVLAVDIGLPPRGEVQVSWQVLESVTKNLDGQVAPSPRLDYSGKIVRSEWIPNPDVYEGGRKFPAWGTARVHSPTVVRRLRRMRVEISPLVFLPGMRSAVWTKRIRIIVRFPRGGSGPSVPAKETLFHRNLINFDVARHWHMGKDAGFPKQMRTRLFETNSERYRILVGDGDETDFSKDGIYQITGSWLAENDVNIDGVNCAGIAMYAGTGKELPTQRPLSEDPGLAREIPVQIVDRDGDGSFDSADVIRFYGQGTSIWEYDSSDSLFRFKLHRYTNQNVYWLVLGGPSAGRERMGSRDRTRGTTPSRTENTCGAYAHEERNEYAINDEGDTWFWQAIGPGDDSEAGVLSFTIAYDAPGVASGTGGILHLFGRYLINGNVGFDGSDLQCNVDLGGRLVGEPSLINESGTLEMSTISSNMHIDGATLIYTRDLALAGNGLRFHGVTDAGPIRYRIDPKGSSETLYCYRVRTKWDIDYLGSVDGADGVFSIDDSALGGEPFMYVVESEQRFRVPTAVQADVRPGGENTLTLLRDAGHRADWIIISPDSFVVAAEWLATHRKSSQTDSVDHPAVVRLSDVYDEFAGGLEDPVAIRDFLLFAYHRWARAPTMVLFFGDGSVDYKGYRYNSPRPFPGFQRGSLCTDDFFAYVEYDSAAGNFVSVPSLVLGRIPAATVEEAEIAIDKILEVEDPSRADWGPWRQRIILAADDDLQGDTLDPIPEHALESENVAELTDSLNKALEIKKLYLFDYTLDSRFQFPEATRDFIEMVNQGCMIVNYVGHGAEYGWADEALFYVADADRLQNKGRYPIMFSASCSVGKFDDPHIRSFYEVLMCLPDKGALGGVAATRPSNSKPNNALNKAYFRYLFGPDRASTGTALLLAKLSTANRGNNEMYLFFGDPALRYLSGSTRIVFESMPDSLKARDKITVTGKVQGSQGTDASFNGNVLLQVYKGYKAKSHFVVQNQLAIDYKIWDDFIFSGQTSVKNGEFKQTFLVPAKINYGEAKTRMTAFAWSESQQSSAFGFVDSIYTGGTADYAVEDVQGPEIRFAPADSSLSGGTEFDETAFVSLPFSLAILVEDSMGIDVTSQGPDEGLCLAVPGTMAKTNINSKFRYQEGDFRRGRAVHYFEPGSLPPGEHTVEVTARDGLGNLAAKTLRVVVQGDSALQLSDVFNYPNPFSGDTRVYYKLSQAADVTIKVFTRSGRLIRVFDDAQNPQEWDGRDQAGNAVANGVYFYKVIAVSYPDAEENRTTVEVLEKMMVAR